MKIILAVLGLFLFSTAVLADSTPSFTLPVQDLQYINRLTWGVNQASALQFKQLGKSAWLNSQLESSNDADLPDVLQQRIAAMSISTTSIVDLLALRQQAQQHINSTTDPDQKAALIKTANQQMNAWALQAAERDVLRDLYSPHQLQQVMTWFWFNHFNVLRHKGLDNLFIADYIEHAIRPHALGKFSDLVWATLTHPAMLIYLDNQHNAVDASNENYAREIMELHTLGVNGGYSQTDVQALAAMLTGVGFRQSAQCLLGQNQLDGVPREDINPLFCFGPARHDNSAKHFLGQDFPANGGREEITRAVNLLIHSPATAQHISREMATYLLGDQPPDEVVNAMALTFRRSDGDIAQTLTTLIHADAFNSAGFVGKQFKDPMRYVLSSVRLLYSDSPILNTRLVIGWINQLGEPLYEHVSPDGYPLTGQAWLSADQIAKRLDTSKSIYWGSGPLYVDENTTLQLDNNDKNQLQTLRKQAREDHPIASFAIYDLLHPMLSTTTLQALDKSLALDEWNSLLLSSPEWMYR